MPIEMPKSAWAWRESGLAEAAGFKTIIERGGVHTRIPCPAVDAAVKGLEKISVYPEKDGHCLTIFVVAE
jgi:hypothetical protein